jgi:hypothetical protein
VILPPKTEIRAYKYVEPDGSSSRFHRQPGHRVVRHKVGRTYTSKHGFWVATREWVHRMLTRGEAVLEVSFRFEDVVEAPVHSPLFPAKGTFRVRRYTVVSIAPCPSERKGE